MRKWKKTAIWKRIVALGLAIMTVLTGIYHEEPEIIQAADYQYAMMPMAYLRVTNGESGHGGRKCIDFAGADDGRDAFYAPFDGKVVRMYTDWGGGNHDVIIESSSPVRWADGTVDYVCIWMAHDDDVSDMKVGKTFKQGEEIYREGNYGNSTGNHVHFVCGKGKYSGLVEKTSGWTIKNEVSAYNVFWLYGNTNVKNTGGYSWKTLEGSTSDFKDASASDLKGCLDHCSGGSGVVNVSGWALDLANKTKTMDVYVYVGGPAESYGTSGVEQFIIKANGSRADVGAAYPGTGDYHGFEASLNTTLSGEQDVYVYVMNPETGVSIYIKSIKVNIEDINIAPTVATISSDKKEIAVGEEITFSFSSDYGTQYYIWIVDTADWSTVAVKGSNEGDCYSTLITYSTSSLPVGKYYAYVTASNSAGYIDSAGIYVDVVTVPTVAEITANKTNASEGEEITFSFFSDYGTQYYIWIVDTADWSTVVIKGSNEGDCYSTSSTYKISSLPTGKYYAYVTAANCAGYVDSEGVYFDVITSVTEVKLSKSNATLSKRGDSLQLTATVSPSEAANKSLKWESSDETVATVSDSGLVTAVNRGICTIKATALDGSGKSDSCEITVRGNLHIAESVDDLESTHPYEVNINDIWQYTLENAPALRVTFDKKTVVENGADYIHIYDGTGALIGSYTGEELSGKTLIIEGNTLQIELVSNGETCDYGFKVDSIKACEVPIRYSISFNGNGSTSGSMEKLENCYSDEIYTLPENTFARTGYEFTGWNTSADGTGIAYTDKEEVKNLTEVKDSTVVLYAQWKPNTYNITFNPNGGRLDTEQKCVVYDSSYGELPVPSIVGGIFLGWFTDMYEGTLVTADDIVKLTADQTLYAHWELVYEAATPIANIPTGSEVEAGTKVALMTETNGAQIYYTTDAEIGMNVSPKNGILYEDAIAITENVTIYAVAVKSGYNQSEVLVVSYTVMDETVDWGDITEADRAEMGLATTADIPQELWVAGVFDCDYTGKAITYPDLHVYNHKTMLQPKVDYTVKYKNNTKAGLATITITGKGNYAGSITKTFSIRPLDLSNANMLDVTVPYNGKVQKGTTTVTYLLNGKTVTLQKGTDFTYVYPGTNSKAEDYDRNAFKEAGTYTVTLVGKGNYTGEVTFTQQITKQFVISKMSLGKIANQKYTGSAIEPKITLMNGKDPLTKDVDYTVAYSNNVEVGTATITITGIGEYTGTRTATFKITGTSLSKTKVNGFVSSLPWTGEQVKQNVILSYAGTEYLTENVDYIVTYQNNTEVGTATVIFTGKGGYTGSVKKTYKITGLPMNKAVVSGLESSMEYNYGEMMQSNYVLTYTKAGGAVITLKEGTDYTVSYQNNQKAGKATIIFKGINGYTGTLKKNYTITAYHFADAAGKVKVTAIADQIYKKGGVTPKPVITYTGESGTVVLVEGKDYTLKYANNKKVASKTASKAPSVTITGKGGFKGSLIAKFTIVGSDISTVTMTAGDVVYQNKANICKPSIALYDADGKKLSAGTDYSKKVIYTYAKDVEVTQVVNKQTIYITRLQGEEVDKKDIIPVGAEITATVTGMKNYAGDGSTPSTQSATFRFVAANIAKATVKVAAQTYTGKAIEPTKDDITVKVGKVTLEKTDYEIVGYSNNVKKGTAKVTIRGIGNYGGEKTVTFKINSKSMNYTIVYDKNAEDATGTMKASGLSAGKPLSANTYKRAGYKFVGWNTKADGSGESYSNKEAFYLKGFMWIFGKNVTLYAQWEAK